MFTVFQPLHAFSRQEDPRPAIAASSIAVAEVEKLSLVIQRAVSQRTEGRIHALHVTVESDCVVLQGRCTTYYCKQLAQHAAMELIGERLLRNRIEVFTSICHGRSAK